MFLLSRRQVRAVLTGAAAAGAYLAGAEIGSRKPVKVGALFFLSTAALAGVMGQVASSRASVKATTTELRLNNLLANGGKFGGDIVVGGNHTVMGKSSFHNDIDLNSSNMNGLQEINSSSGPNVGLHVPLYMNSHNIYGQGGSTHITDGGGSYL